MQSTTKFVSSLAKCLRGSSRVVSQLQTRMCSAAVPAPTFDGEGKKYPEKIQKLVGQISQLTLLETADLNELLKKTLNITDAPVMQMATNVQAVAQDEAKSEEKEEEPVRVKSSFTVRLIGYDAAKKVSVIKEVKKVMPGIILSDAKALIEKYPSVLRADASKEEAETIQKALEEAGAKIEVS